MNGQEWHVYLYLGYTVFFIDNVVFKLCEDYIVYLVSEEQFETFAQNLLEEFCVYQQNMFISYGHRYSVHRDIECICHKLFDIRLTQQ